MKKPFLLTISLLFFTGCSFSSSWTGFYYPDGCLSCTEDYIFSPEFATKKDCLDWAYDLQSERNNPDDDYECGKNCKMVDYKTYICKETVE